MKTIDEMIAEADALFDKGDDAEAYELYLEASMQDDDRATLRLAQMYYYGRYVRRDYLKSYQYYCILAEKGIPKAMEQVVNMNLMLEHEMAFDVKTLKESSR